MKKEIRKTVNIFFKSGKEVELEACKFERTKVNI